MLLFSYCLNVQAVLIVSMAGEGDEIISLFGIKRGKMYGPGAGMRDRG
jgi:hypothetical protein